MSLQIVAVDTGDNNNSYNLRKKNKRHAYGEVIVDDGEALHYTKRRRCLPKKVLKNLSDETKKEITKKEEAKNLARLKTKKEHISIKQEKNESNSRNLRKQIQQTHQKEIGIGIRKTKEKEKKEKGNIKRTQKENLIDNNTKHYSFAKIDEWGRPTVCIIHNKCNIYIEYEDCFYEISIIVTLLEQWLNTWAKCIEKYSYGDITHNILFKNKQMEYNQQKNIKKFEIDGSSKKERPATLDGPIKFVSDCVTVKENPNIDNNTLVCPPVVVLPPVVVWPTNSVAARVESVATITTSTLVQSKTLSIPILESSPVPIIPTLSVSAPIAQTRAGMPKGGRGMERRREGERREGTKIIEGTEVKRRTKLGQTGKSGVAKKGIRNLDNQAIDNMPSLEKVENNYFTGVVHSYFTNGTSGTSSTSNISGTSGTSVKSGKSYTHADLVSVDLLSDNLSCSTLLCAEILNLSNGADTLIEKDKVNKKRTNKLSILPHKGYGAAVGHEQSAILPYGDNDPKYINEIDQVLEQVQLSIYPYLKNLNIPLYEDLIGSIVIENGYIDNVISMDYIGSQFMLDGVLQQSATHAYEYLKCMYVYKDCQYLSCIYSHLPDGARQIGEKKERKYGTGYNKLFSAIVYDDKTENEIQIGEKEKKKEKKEEDEAREAKEAKETILWMMYRCLHQLPRCQISDKKLLDYYIGSLNEEFGVDTYRCATATSPAYKYVNTNRKYINLLELALFFKFTSSYDVASSLINTYPCKIITLLNGKDDPACSSILMKIRKMLLSIPTKLLFTPDALVGVS